MDWDREGGWAEPGGRADWTVPPGGKGSELRLLRLLWLRLNRARSAGAMPGGVTVDAAQPQDPAVCLVAVFRLWRRLDLNLFVCLALPAKITLQNFVLSKGEAGQAPSSASPSQVGVSG